MRWASESAKKNVCPHSVICIDETQQTGALISVHFTELPRTTQRK